MSSAGSTLTASLVLKGDASGIVGAADQGTAALDKLRSSTVQTNAAFAEQAAASGVAAKAIEAGSAVKAAETAKAAQLSAALAANSTAHKQLAASAEDAGVHIEGLGRQAERLGESLGIPLGSARLMMYGIKDLIAVLASAEGMLLLFGIAAVGAMGAAVVSENRLEAETANLNKAIISSGNALHGSTQDYETLADQIANVADVSQRSGRTILETWLSAGVTSKQTLLDLTAAARAYAAATGTDAVKASETMAQGLKDPVAWVKQLNEQYGLFNSAQTAQIEALAKSGNQMAADDAIALALTARLKAAEDQTSLWGGIWDDVSKHASDYFRQLGQWLQNDPSAAMGAFYSPKSAQPPSIAPGSNDNTAALNRESAALQDVMRQYDTYGTQLKTIDDTIQRVTADEKSGAITREQAAKDLSQLSLKRAEVLKAEQNALLNLNDAEKMHAQEVKDYVIKTGPQAVAAAEADAKALAAQAAASDGTAGSIKQLQQQYEITKATLPAVTLEQYAHGAALQAIQKDVANVTAAMKQQQQAQDELAAKTDIRSQFTALTTFYKDVGDAMTGYAANEATTFQQSKAILDLDVHAAQEWRDQSLAAIAAVKDGHDALAAEIQEVYQGKIAKAYADNLARTHDWGSGVELALRQMNADMNDWAKTSSSLITGVSNEFENDLVNMVVTGKSTLLEFFQWIEEQLLKLLYQKYLASVVSGLFGDAVGWLGGALGAGDGTGDTGAGSASASSILANPWHAGGTISNDNSAWARSVSLAEFENARRYHLGGAIFGAGEVPVIAQAGEVMFTNLHARIIDAALRRPIVMQAPANSNATAPVTINVHTPPGTETKAKQSRGPDGGFQIDLLVKQVDKSLAKMSHMGKSAFTQSLENTHGIVRSPRG